jgi:hypothetical protein
MVSTWSRSRNRNRNRDLSKVGTGTGTGTEILINSYGSETLPKTSEVLIMINLLNIIRQLVRYTKEVLRFKMI